MRGRKKRYRERDTERYREIQRDTERYREIQKKRNQGYMFGFLDIQYATV